MKRVYQQTIAYDAFSMMTSRTGTHWNEEIGFSETYTNGRIQNTPGLTYDAAGNLVLTGSTYSPEDFQQTNYDASGRRISVFTSSKGRFGDILNRITEERLEYEFDGEGRPLVEKKGKQHYQMNYPPSGALAMVVQAYQVWSTVLGSSLTKLDKDGGKVETRVFAGGAVIAKQKRFTTNGQPSDWVEWTTADPVTGTETNFGGEADEEHEPLGQTIDRFDKSDNTPDPPLSQTYIGGASEPEWQCVGKAFYGGTFTAMPLHCQKAELYAAGSRLPWEDEVSVTLIVGKYYTDSPLEKSPLVPFIDLPEGKSKDNLAMGKAIRSTAKPTGEGNPKIKGIVQVYEPEDEPLIIDMSKTDDVNPNSFGKPALLNKEENDALDERIEIIKEKLKNEDCIKFLEKFSARDKTCQSQF